MARNQEKAQALLNRFVTAKRDANRPDKSQRPYLATECNNVSDCELCMPPLATPHAAPRTRDTGC